jgi:hypothetical protein
LIAAWTIARERTNFTLEKVNVGGRSWGSQLVAARRKQMGDYMEGKFIKRFTMLSLVSMFSLCAAVASANAQLINPVRAKIPFAFSMGDKKLQAGEYTFRGLSPASKMMLASSVDANTSVFQWTFGIQVLTAKNESKLVFHRYGDQYFLEQIWLSGEKEGTQVPESRSERTIRRQLAQTQQSNLSGKVTKLENVEVVASLF